MRVLTRYLVRDYLTTFLLTVAVLTFVMTIGSVVRIIDLISRGIAGGLIFQFFILGIPYVLQFTIPMATLTTTLLLFTRLSLDGEITAMKACGLSLWGILRPVLLASLFLSAASLWLSGDVSPHSRYRQRRLTAQVGELDPLALIEEGRFTRDIPGYLIYVGRREGNRLEDLEVYQLGERGVLTSIRARWGEVSVRPEQQIMQVDLYDARIERHDSTGTWDPAQAKSFTAAHYPKRIDLTQLSRSGAVSKKRSHHTTRELLDALATMNSIRFQEKGSPQWLRERMEILVELSVRHALSLGCFGFTLLGVPLGMHSRRKESSIGVMISLGVIFLFYFTMILARSLSDHPEWMPDVLVWIPLFIAEGIGLVAIHRAN